MNRFLVMVALVVGCAEAPVEAEDCECWCEDELIQISNQESELKEAHEIVVQLVARQKVLEDALRLFVEKSGKKQGKDRPGRTR